MEVRDSSGCFKTIRKPFHGSKGKAQFFSPWNSFLLWHFTKERVFATDESIAERTLLFNIHKRDWNPKLLRLFEMPLSILPKVFPICHPYGHYLFKEESIPILCSIGDHQGALIGLDGFEKG